MMSKLCDIINIIDNLKKEDGRQIFLFQLYFICKNDSLGVEQAASPIVSFLCKDDGTYNVPLNQTWPECLVRTTTAKPGTDMLI